MKFGRTGAAAIVAAIAFLSAVTNSHAVTVGCVTASPSPVPVDSGLTVNICASAGAVLYEYDLNNDGNVDVLSASTVYFASYSQLQGLGEVPGVFYFVTVKAVDAEGAEGPPSDAVAYSLAVAETPLPAALPLFASGLGALGLLGWRRKKKAAALVA